MNPVPLPEHSLRPEDYVPGRFEGRLWVEWHDCLDSTNLELMRRPSLPESEHPLSPVWLMAGEQTAGRGRRGKAWKAQPGHALTASLGCELPPDRLADVGAVPLVAGIVIAEYLATLGVDVMVKWPNDLCRVLPGPRRTLAKVGGILCEMRTRSQGSRLVIGCGLNLQALPEGLVTDQPAAALFDTLSGPQSLALALGVGQVLLAGVEQLLAEGFGVFSARWQHVDVLAGRPVRVHHTQGPRDATALGIDAPGALQVCYDDAPGHLAVVTAEQVSIRPRAD